MNLLHILVLCLLTGTVGLLARGRWRSWALLVTSVLAIYWLQPATPIRHLDFWFPTASIGLTSFVWAATVSKTPRIRREDAVTFLVVGFLILAIGSARDFGFPWHLTATRPPRLSGTLVALTVFTLLFLALPRLRRVGFSAVGGFTLLILGLFVVLKTEPLAVTASGWLRRVSGQSSDLAASMDLSWLGFSYVAFRLLHALRDHAAGRLPELSLREFIVYVLFFPTLTAGPIDRAARFLGDLRASKILTASETVQGGSRVLIGVFKKFVLADTLGLIALSAGNANQIMSRFWLWIVLYAYAFRLYLDFSGYTDVAIGMGQLAGVTLPENFNRPYTRRNLTVFWTSWHMTLAQWFRAYFFNPLTRALRRSRRKIPAPVVILIGQVTTMGLIGLWHGITWNFLLWGLWHGAGLFIHNRWVELQRAHPQWFTSKWYASRPAQALSVLATFHFVAVGWLWFALPDVGQSWALFLRLIGI